MNLTVSEMLTDIVDRNRAKWGDHSYMVGYLSSMISSLCRESPETSRHVERSLRRMIQDLDYYQENT